MDTYGERKNGRKRGEGQKLGLSEYAIFLTLKQYKYFKQPKKQN